jgi:hypothetical protein
MPLCIRTSEKDGRQRRRACGAGARCRRSPPHRRPHAARRWGLRRAGAGSAQAGRVVGDGLDLRIGHLERDGAHHAVRVVCAHAVAEGLHLRFGVFGELAGQARILRRHARAGGAVAGGTGGDALGGDARAPDLLAEVDGAEALGRLRLLLEGGEVLGEAAHVGFLEAGDHRAHDRVLTHRRRCRSSP